MNPENIYPRTNDHETVYLKNVIKNPNILVGNFTMYNDFVYDPRQFEKNNVLYHYPINHDKLIIGKFCSIACGAKFLFTSANHTQASLSTYPFPIFFEEWGLDVQNISSVTTTRCAALCGRPGTGSHGLSATMPGSGNGMSIPENSMKRTKNMRTATR